MIQGPNGQHTGLLDDKGRKVFSKAAPSRLSTPKLNRQSEELKVQKASWMDQEKEGGTLVSAKAMEVRFASG